jgi:hypothetical protein
MSDHSAMTPDNVARGTSQSSQTSQNSENLDFSTWLTKQQAAEAIGVSTKTIESFAKDGKIQQAVWKPQNRGAAKAVYHPDDVARIASERRPGLQAFVLPAISASNSNGHGHETGITPITTTTADVASVLCSLVAALQALSPARAETSESSEKSTAAYVNKTDALAIAGVSSAALRAAVQAGEVTQRGRRYRRQDLEAL